MARDFKNRGPLIFYRPFLQKFLTPPIAIVLISSLHETLFKSYRGCLVFLSLKSVCPSFMPILLKHYLKILNMKDKIEPGKALKKNKKFLG